MKWVRLYTRAGDYVATAQVPQFDPPADVIQWGNRFFVLDNTGEQLRYREGLLYYTLAARAETTGELEGGGDKV